MATKTPKELAEALALDALASLQGLQAALAGSEAARERLIEVLRLPHVVTPSIQCWCEDSLRATHDKACREIRAALAANTPSQALQSRLDEEHSRATAAALAVIEGRANYEPIAQALAERIEREVAKDRRTWDRPEKQFARYFSPEDLAAHDAEVERRAREDERRKFDATIPLAKHTTIWTCLACGRSEPWSEKIPTGHEHSGPAGARGWRIETRCEGVENVAAHDAKVWDAAVEACARAIEDDGGGSWSGDEVRSLKGKVPTP